MPSIFDWFHISVIGTYIFYQIYLAWIFEHLLLDFYLNTFFWGFPFILYLDFYSLFQFIFISYYIVLSYRYYELTYLFCGKTSNELKKYIKKW